MPRTKSLIGGKGSTVPVRKPASYIGKNVSVEPKGSMPVMPDAICMTPIGMSVADGGMSNASSAEGIKSRREAKNQCYQECPALLACREYVLREEKPAGSWGGVWGGLDLWNRQGLELIEGPDGEKSRLIPYRILPLEELTDMIPGGRS